MTITILHINTQSIHLKLPSIQNLIHINNPDFISIQETFLKLNTHPKPSIPGYKIKDFRRPNRTARGGIILAYKESIKHSETKKITTTKNNEYIKSTFYLNDLPFTVISLYNPKEIDIDTDEIKNLLSDTSILIGDLNCRHPSWGDVTTNTGGQILFNFMCNENINSTFHTESTHVHHAPPHTESMIDIALWKANHRYIRNIIPEKLEDINSDHYPILFKLETNLSKPKSTKTIYLYHQFDWDSANDKIRNINIDDLTKDGIDNAIAELETIIHEIQENIPKKPSTPATKVFLKKSETNSKKKKIFLKFGKDLETQMTNVS